MSPQFRATGYRLTRNVWLPLACAIACAVAYGVVTFAPTTALAWPVALFTLIFASVLAVLVFVRNAFPTKTFVDVRIDERGLWVAGAGPTPPEEIVEAKLVPRPGREASMVLELGIGKERMRRVRLWLRDEDARDAIHVLGTMPGERRTPFALTIPFGRRFAVSYLATALILTSPRVLAGGLHPSNAFLLVVGLFTSVPFFALIVALFAGVLKGNVTVGSEGVSVRWLLKRRFTSFRDVSSIATQPRAGDAHAFDTVLVGRDGSRLRLSAVEAPDTSAQLGAASRALYGHVMEAFERFGRLAREGSDPRAALAREGRSGKEWLAGIDVVIGGGAARYRVAAVDPDQLAGVARDPNADPEARAAAAAALLRTKDPKHRHAVRVAADACVEPELRDVLGALADAEEDAAIAEALDRAPKRRMRA